MRAEVDGRMVAVPSYTLEAFDIADEAEVEELGDTESTFGDPYGRDRVAR